LNLIPNRLRSKVLKALYLIIPIIIIVGIIEFSGFIVRISKYVPACPFHLLFGGYCPGCGNTRSILALLHGDVLGSLHYNITIVLLCLIGIAFYIEGGLKFFGYEVKIVPRNSVFWFIILGLMLIYYVARNIFPFLAPI